MAQLIQAFLKCKGCAVLCAERLDAYPLTDQDTIAQRRTAGKSVKRTQLLGF